MKTEDKTLITYADAQIRVKRLISSFSKEKDQTKTRRKIRKLDLDVEALRQAGDILEDETFIPMRIIDMNIGRELPGYISFLKQSRRIAIFNCLDNPNVDTQQLESDFTRGLTYNGWERPHFRCLDGAQVHGWDAVEVIYDERYPFNIGIEHIGHDKLIFAEDCIDLQYQSLILREYNLTLFQLKSMTSKFGFKAEQVKKLVDRRKDTDDVEKTLCVYKVFMRLDGIIYKAWYSGDAEIDDWLSDPAPCYVGIRHQEVDLEAEPSLDPQNGQPIPAMKWVDTPMTMYPLFLLQYRETEEQKITETVGRVYLDENKQEAMTSIASAFVNGINRASNIYGSPKNNLQESTSIKVVENLTLKHGAIVNQPFDFWNTPYPDPEIIRALQYFETQNATENNQVAFAVNNRKDSRKTAKEIEASQQQSALINSVQIALFSMYLRDVYTFVWKCVQSQALQGAIVLLPIYDDSGTVVGNRDDLIGLTYDVRAAGDIDVIQRQERLSRMKQDWPVVQTTPLAEEFFLDIIKLEYPEDAVRYERIFRAGSEAAKLKQLLMRTATVLQGAISPDEMASLSPEQQQSLVQLGAEIQQALTVNQNGDSNIRQGNRQETAGAVAG